MTVKSETVGATMNDMNELKRKLIHLFAEHFDIGEQCIDLEITCDTNVYRLDPLMYGLKIDVGWNEQFNVR